MADPIRNPLSDIRGASRLAIEATVGVTSLVEAMHHTIARGSWILGAPAAGATRGVTGLVYRSIRGVSRLVGGSIEAVLAVLVPMFGAARPWPEREAVLAAVNGVLGDHLAATGNPLAIPMRLRRAGLPLELERAALARAIPRPGGKVLVLVHGLCMNDLQWTHAGHDHGAALARDLGYTPVYLHYNSGLHVSVNGRAFAGLLETLVGQWPVPLQELAIVAHSMGGLVARSAHHYGTLAGQRWPRHLRKLVFLGTPHHGAPLERGGNLVDVLLGVSPYSAPFTRLGKIRSAGITDLRHGNLLDEDWQGRDRFRYSKDPRRAVPLPEGVRCYAIAATTGRNAANPNDRPNGRLPGDGLVPLNSALGRHRQPGRDLSFPPSRQWIAYGLGHWSLLGRCDVYERIRDWFDDQPARDQPARRPRVSARRGAVAAPRRISHSS